MKNQKEVSLHALVASAQVEKCTSCGLCKDVCPVFTLTQREAESPRGKINLLKALSSGEIRAGSETVDIFNRCLLCYACQDACPAGVETEKIWITSRQRIADEGGRSFVKSFAIRLALKHAWIWNLFVRIGKVLTGQKDALVVKNRVFPKPATRRLDKILPELFPAVSEPKGKVAFFPGCLLTEVYPDIGLKAAEVLSKLGYDVLTLRERVCCGAPAFNNGEFNTARSLAEKNIELFGSLDVDAIVSPDATCGGAFRHEYETLIPEGSRLRKKYEEVKSKVVDFSEFVFNDLDGRSDITLGSVGQQIIFHDSCHLNHLQKKADLPKKLLAMVPGIEVHDGQRNELCCGFGGSYSFMYPGESRAIALKKIANLLADNGSKVAVGSPGCLWKLRSEAAFNGIRLDVHHYLEFLHESIMGTKVNGPPKSGLKGEKKQGDIFASDIEENSSLK